MLYNKIDNYSNGEFHCDERMADCPECSTPICVFCEDSCEGCGESIF